MTAQTIFSAPKPRRSVNLLSLMLNVTAFCYLLSVLLFGGLDALSRISIVIGGFLMVLVLLQGASRGRIKLPALWFVPWLFCAYAAVSLLWAGDEQSAMDPFVSMLSAVLGASAIWWARHNGMSWKPVVWGAAVGAIAITASMAPEIARGGLSGRAAGLAANPNQAAFLLCFAALLTWCAPVKMPRLLSWWAAGSILFAVVFTGSRKALLCAAALLILFAIRAVGNLKRALLMLVLLIGAVTVVLVLIDPGQALESVTSLDVYRRTEAALGGREQSLHVRQNMFGAAMELWLERPLAGWGIGQFAARSSFSVYSHSNYSETLANLGLIGLALHYWFHVRSLSRSYRGFRAGIADRQAAFVLLLMILMLDSGMVSMNGKASWLLLVFCADLSDSSLRAVPWDKSFLAGINRRWMARPSVPGNGSRPWRG